MYTPRSFEERDLPWSYVAVHASGTLRRHDDPAFLRAHLDALTARHEASRPRPWQPSDAPAEYIEQQLEAIVGIEMTIDRIEGKWKVSQNRAAADVDGVIDRLGTSPIARDRTVADSVPERRGPSER